MIRLTICAILIACTPELYSQGFQKYYGGPEEEHAYNCQHTPDNGSIICGRTLSFGTGGWEGYLLKLDELGDTMWTRTYGNVVYDEFQDVNLTSDGGYIITGHTGTNDWAGDLLLLKVDENGDIVWDQVYGGAEGLSDKGYSVMETTDGGFVASGTTASYGQGGDDVYVVKTSSTGNIEWTSVIGTAEDIEAGREIQQTQDGGYIVTGYTEGLGTSFLDVILIKLNGLGVVQWSKTYGGSAYDIGYTVQETTDNGFIIGATTDSFGAGGWEVYLLKTNAAGVLQWSRTYGLSGEDRGHSARQTSDGGYIMSGRSNSFGFGGLDAILLKTDGSGNFQWSRAYGGSSEDMAWIADECDDGGFLTCGYSFSYGAGSRELMVMKTDASGVSGCNETLGNFSMSSAPTVTTDLGIVSSGGIASDVPTALRGTETVVTVECGASISTSPTSETSYCQGDMLTVDFTSAITFNPGNIHTAQLSDAAGSFASPVAIGTLSSELGNGSIDCTIPGITPMGFGYRVRVVSSAPGIIGSDNGEDIAILDCSIIQGCTDPQACNYDPEATEDDGSCECFSCVGCTDPLAANYDSEATVSCDCCFYLDTTTLCGDGTFWSPELQQCVVLCPGDMDYNGVVNTLDLLVFLSVFGLPCQ